MTSTEFTAGICDGARISSKVLKPPGGGSSDIFGLGGSSSTNKSNAEKTSTNDSNTRSRLFGDPSDPLPPTPKRNTTLHQSSIFENGHQALPTRTKKVYVRRNPITGEEIEMSVDSENGECDNKEVKEDKGEEAVNVPREVVDVPSKPIQTSIRVRNPPGGKSSGIF